ncbi:WXG100 family type VII secretion target [Actinomadura rupiterrae]|uniref:WXG100 family type VII secretion target n=1 Tax=Actinomadura rupiterrae TaxID=559627 RepID=UPI0020A4ADCF|nr:WXG100 family type VII secretion target [Actinomadura rupiterrae]MCP2343616.1 uncharacterized protein YukE [Actinomadura rupiterrae]
MSDGGYVEVDTKALRKAGTGFDTGADHLKDIFTRLNSKLSAEGKCWGNDKTGQQFAQNYETPSTNMLKSFGDLGKALHDIKGGIDEMADNYDKAEHHSKIK